MGVSPIYMMGEIMSLCEYAGEMIKLGDSVAYCYCKPRSSLDPLHPYLLLRPISHCENVNGCPIYEMQKKKEAKKE